MDKQVSGTSYETGCFVWLKYDLRRKGVSPKLSYRWDGPYKIMSKLSDVTYRIQRSRRSKPKIVHFDRTKPYEGPVPEDWMDDLVQEDVTPEGPSGSQIPDPRLIVEELSQVDSEIPSSSRYPKRKRKSPNYFD